MHEQIASANPKMLIKEVSFSLDMARIAMLM